MTLKDKIKIEKIKQKYLTVRKQFKNNGYFNCSECFGNICNDLHDILKELEKINCHNCKHEYLCDNENMEYCNHFEEKE
jgi:hypothetical protein